MKVVRELKHLRKDSERFRLAPGPDSWYDLMHWHPDWTGVGNLSAGTRELCVRAARNYLDEATRALGEWSKPSQAWTIVDTADSGSTATYVHSVNPNSSGAPFPHPSSSVDWSTPAPPWMQSIFPPDRYWIGTLDATFWVVSRASRGMLNQSWSMPD